MIKTDALIIGAGPTGLFTAHQLKLIGLDCEVVDNLDKIGGQCIELYPDKPIYDIPAVPECTGEELTNNLINQLKPFDIKFHLGERVDEVKKDNDNWIVKTNSKKELVYISLFGIWIGLAFMMKTFLVAVPITSLLPYLIKKKYIFTSKYFWLGLIIGFTPFIVWSTSINTFLDKNIIFHLLDKFNNLSKENTFTNPFYYYLWNIPVTFLPWSIFSIIGLVHGLKSKNSQGFILFYFPLILIILISSFSTKTPYYPLQISSILSLNAFIGIKYLIEEKRFKFLFIFISSRVIPLFVVTIIFIYFLFLKATINFNLRENTFLISGLILFALAWSFIKKSQNPSKMISILIIGPYLMTSCFLQSGLFTDRSREIRETMENISSLKTSNNRIIKVDKSSIINATTHSKIIRIALLTPNLGEGIDNIKSLKSSELAWSIFPKEDQKKMLPLKLFMKMKLYFLGN